MRISSLPCRTDTGEVTGWCFESGMPTEQLFASALQVWAIAQENDPTVADAALAFNVTPFLIRQAIEAHAFMYLSGETIEHEGE